MSLTREEVALRAVQELEEGMTVNLGLGLPTLIADFLPLGPNVMLQSENGILGFGPYAAEGEQNPYHINAGGQPVTLKPGATFFSSAESFVMIRGGHIDLCFLGALQVSERGDLANWMVPERRLGGIGGAMDLAAGAQRLVVLMDHTTKKGMPKIVRRCSYPLTAAAAVDRIITDLAVIDVTAYGLVLRELAPGVTVEEVCARTEPPLMVSEPVSVMVL
ncbi:MAG: 3-oxoacid CoA-transferase subunit B [Dehalococcoidia bacterium]